jgi:putative intracellular protease/amidase
MKHDEKGDQVAVDRMIDKAKPEDYDGLVLPAGSPTRMRCAPIRS